MTASTAIQTNVLLPTISTRQLDSRRAQTSVLSDACERDIAPEKVTIDVSTTTVQWAPPTITQAPRSRKSVALALVVVLHGVALYALGHVKEPSQTLAAAPIQIVSIETPEAEQPLTTPPKPAFEEINVSLPVEPIVEVTVLESSHAISVEPRIAESKAISGTVVATPKLVSSVEYIREPIAKYPAAARALKQRGTVTVRALVDAEGHAREVNVQQSSGYRLLDDIAKEAVANALFKPYTESGRSMAVYVLIPIEFGTRS